MTPIAVMAQMQAHSGVQANELGMINESEDLEGKPCTVVQCVSVVSNIGISFGLAWGSYAIGHVILQVLDIRMSDSIDVFRIGLCAGIVALIAEFLCQCCALPDLNQVLRCEAFNCYQFLFILFQAGPVASLFGYIIMYISSWNKDTVEGHQDQYTQEAPIDMLKVGLGSLIGSLSLMSVLLLCFQVCAKF